LSQLLLWLGTKSVDISPLGVCSDRAVHVRDDADRVLRAEGFSARGGSANDYMAQGPNDAYAYGFGSYDPCMAYDPYCSVALWYLAHAHYYSRGDSDNDCDDRNRGGSGGASHHKPTAAGGGFRGGRGGDAARCA
jgi:hypothetical protein